MRYRGGRNETERERDEIETEGGMEREGGRETDRDGDSDRERDRGQEMRQRGGEMR